MARPAAGAVLALALLAGCSEFTPPADLRPGWDQGTLLHAVRVAPAGEGWQAQLDHPDLAQPLSCRAYRNDRALPEDDCDVVGDGSGWRLEATWSGEVPGYSSSWQKRVVAYDGAGRYVAWWSGQTSGDTLTG